MSLYKLKGLCDMPKLNYSLESHVPRSVYTVTACIDKGPAKYKNLMVISHVADVDTT